MLIFTNAQCPMPNAQFPIPQFTYKIQSKPQLHRYQIHQQG
jgi:hypothetical protein